MLISELGREVDAAAVAPLGPWLREHSVGRLVAARLEAAGGRIEVARAAQRRLAAGVSGTLRDYVEAIAAVQQAAIPDVPRAALLLTCV